MTATVLFIYFLAEKENSFIIEPMLQSHHRQSAKKRLQRKKEIITLSYSLADPVHYMHASVIYQGKNNAGVTSWGPVPEIPEKMERRGVTLHYYTFLSLKLW